MGLLLRQHAEQQFEEELYELKKNETNKVPENWQLSPQSVVTYLMGGKLANGFEVTPKYIGHRRLIEIAVGHGSGIIVVRSTGNSQELGKRASGGGYIR